VIKVIAKILKKHQKIKHEEHMLKT